MAGPERTPEPGATAADKLILEQALVVLKAEIRQDLREHGSIRPASDATWEAARPVDMPGDPDELDVSKRSVARRVLEIGIPIVMIGCAVALSWLYLWPHRPQRGTAPLRGASVTATTPAVTAGRIEPHADERRPPGVASDTPIIPGPSPRGNAGPAPSPPARSETAAGLGIVAPSILPSDLPLAGEGKEAKPSRRTTSGKAKPPKHSETSPPPSPNAASAPPDRDFEALDFDPKKK